MRSWKHWLDIKPPSNRRLLDAALLFALLPHLFMIRLPLVVYVAAVLVAVIRGKPVGRVGMILFALAGPAVIALSFTGAFNFVGLSELSVFIQLIASLLIYAVSLQRLTRTVNFYLVISPMLLLALSYFYHHSIFMLGYAVATLYLFLLLLLWMRMQSRLLEAVRSASILFMGALPIVVLLFLVFPRISFKPGQYGFRDTASIRSGHDGLMHIGSDALLVPSQKVAMEVWFEDGMPYNDALYFRGSVLYEDRGNVWIPAAQKRELGILAEQSFLKGVRYRVTLYPHKKRWLYLLDYPVSISRKSNFNRDMIATWDRPIDEVFRYDAVSVPAPGTVTDVESPVKAMALEVHEGRDPRSETAMRAIREAYGTDRERVDALNRWFRGQRLHYSLEPGVIDLDHPVDAFVFGTQKGYCVHFAAAYATMARMLGVPSRVVTGFKGDSRKSIENYLVVREEDAHAWVEVYIEAAGWMRIDPTVLSVGPAPGDLHTMTVVNAEALPWWRRAVAGIDLYVMYAKFMVQKWVLYYDRSRQMQLLRELMQDTLLVIKFAGTFVLLIAAGVLTYLTLRREPCRDRVLCAVKPFLEYLARQGVVKAPGEDMHAFLARASDTLHVDFREADRLYHDLRYGTSGSQGIRELEALCRSYASKR